MKKRYMKRIADMVTRELKDYFGEGSWREERNCLRRLL